MKFYKFISNTYKKITRTVVYVTNFTKLIVRTITFILVFIILFNSGKCSFKILLHVWFFREKSWKNNNIYLYRYLF